MNKGNGSYRMCKYSSEGAGKLS